MAALSVEHLGAVRKELAERSLRHFIRHGWRYMDPAEFIPNWHIDAMSEHLEAVSRGELRNLIINIPPRHMKSLMVSVAWTAWTWAQETDDLRKRRFPLLGAHVAFLCLSYAQALSTRDSVKSRRLMTSPWYQENWGDRFNFTSDQNAKTRYENDRQGYRIASSVDGVATGEGGDIVLFDDPHNVKEAESPAVREGVLAFWDESLSSRLNNPKTGAYVVIMQRVHERDLTGHILAKNQPGWAHLCLPARYEGDHPTVWARDPRKENGELLWSDRMGETEVAKLETSMGSYAAAGQLQQRPAPRAGGMFQRGWFSPVPAASLPNDLRLCRGWDFAATVDAPGKDPDWTAGVKLAFSPSTDCFYILNVQRARISANEVQRLLLSTAALDTVSCRIRIPQDPGQAGKAQAETFVQLLRGYPVKALPPSGDKVTRATPAAAQAEAGRIKIVMTGDAAQDAWIEPFLAEATVFPMGRHDDQVDGFADAFNELALGPGPARVSSLRM